MRSLKQVFRPRASVFDSNKRDPVHDILDLVKGNIGAAEFFAENYTTHGMRTFLTEAFNRLEGNLEGNAGAQAVFLLSRSMGGGKTHNPMAFGFLCQNPDLWDRVIGYFQEVGSLGWQRQDVPGYLDHRQTIRRTARLPRLHADDGDGHRTKDAAAALLKGMAESDSV